MFFRDWLSQPLRVVAQEIVDILFVSRVGKIENSHHNICKKSVLGSQATWTPAGFVFSLELAVGSNLQPVDTVMRIFTVLSFPTPFRTTDFDSGRQESRGTSWGLYEPI